MHQAAQLLQLLLGLFQGVLFNVEQQVLYLFPGAGNRVPGLGVGAFAVDELHDHLLVVVHHAFGLIRVHGVGLQHVLLKQGRLLIEVSFAGSLAGFAFEQHGLCQLLADAHDRVQAGQRVLEDHGNLVPAQLVEVFFLNFQQVLAVIQHFAAFDDGVTRQDAKDALAGDGFAGAGFTDDGQGLPLVQVEGYVTHRLQFAADGAERDAQIVYLQYFVH